MSTFKKEINHLKNNLANLIVDTWAHPHHIRSSNLIDNIEDKSTFETINKNFEAYNAVYLKIIDESHAKYNPSFIHNLRSVGKPDENNFTISFGKKGL
jgi:hypothetical protein